jgi:hypothetical protein
VNEAIETRRKYSIELLFHDEAIETRKKYSIELLFHDWDITSMPCTLASHSMMQGGFVSSGDVVGGWGVCSAWQIFKTEVSGLVSKIPGSVRAPLLLKIKHKFENYSVLVEDDDDTKKITKAHMPKKKQTHSTSGER